MAEERSYGLAAVQSQWERRLLTGPTLRLPVLSRDNGSRRLLVYDGGDGRIRTAE